MLTNDIASWLDRATRDERRDDAGNGDEARTRYASVWRLTYGTPTVTYSGTPGDHVRDVREEFEEGGHAVPPVIRVR